MINIIIEYKDLILYKAAADLKAEARGYYFSYAWWVLEPLLEMIVFYIVFNLLLKRGGPNFVQFLLIGLIAWKWFGTTVQHCGNSIMGNKDLITRTALPKIIFPTIFLLTDTFKATIVATLILIVLLLTGFPPNKAYFALPILFISQFLMITAVGYTLAAIIPYYPDINILTNLLLRMIWFLSGVFYDPINLSDEKRRIFFLNPMAIFINNYRGILLHQHWPEMMPILIIVLISIALIILSSKFIGRRNTIYPRIVAQ